MIKISKLFYPLFILYSLVSCEYSLTKEHFVDVETPPDNVFIDLRFTTEEDTIFIFNETEIKYSSNDRDDLLYIELSIGDREFFSQPDGDILVLPSKFEIGYHSMIARFYFKTNSGSIADKLDAEAYIIEKRWTVLIDYRKAPSISPNYLITDEGYLKIFWDECEQYNFHSYEVEKTYTTVKIIEDSKHTFFIDSCYIGGYQEYAINTRVLTGNKLIDGQRFSVNIDVPVLQIEQEGIDSLLLSWNKSQFNVKYKIIDDYTTVFETVNDTCIRTNLPAVGDYKLYKLGIFPKGNSCGYTSQFNQKYFHLGTKIANNAPEYAYNKKDQVFYTNTYSEIESYDVDSKQLIKKISLDIFPHSYACPTNSTQMACFTSEQIYIYDNKNLQNPMIIPIATSRFIPSHFLMSDNGYVAFAFRDKYNLVDIAKKKTIITHTIADEPYYSYLGISRITTSQDAAYTAFATTNGLKIYQIKNEQLIELHSDSRSYQSAYFNPLEPDKILITLMNDNNLEIRNVDDFSLIKKIKLPSDAIGIVNIDVKSGYVLLNDEENIFVLDLNLSEVRLKLPAGGTKTQLMGNVFFTREGYYYDITNFIN